MVPSNVRKTNAVKPTNGSKVNHSSSTYAYDHGERRIIDPVVAKLKEARRLEKEKKEMELRQKKGITSKPKSSKPKLKSSIPMRTSGSANLPKKASNDKKNSRTTSVPLQPERRPPATKMNFNELMKKAGSIDQSKLSISFKAKSKSPDTERKSKGAFRKEKSTPATRVKSTSPEGIKSKDKVRYPEIEPQLRAPIPTRKPSEKLAAKLKSRQSKQQVVNHQANEDELESDLDSFIESDEEEYEQQDNGYNRDEIWAIFNRGKQRRDFHYDDYDSDDMEATGAEIFDEELRSKRRAEIEDRREAEEEQRRAELKRQKKLAAARKP